MSFSKAMLIDLELLIQDGINLIEDTSFEELANITKKRYGSVMTKCKKISACQK